MMQLEDRVFDRKLVKVEVSLSSLFSASPGVAKSTQTTSGAPGFNHAGSTAWLPSVDRTPSR